MRKYPSFVSIMFSFLLVSCLTINIYFPAEEVRDAAEKIVQETWGNQTRPQPPAETDSERGASIKTKNTPLFSRLAPLGDKLFIQAAYASPNIDVSSPKIRAIKESIRTRAEKLKPYLAKGNVGISHDGLLQLRSSEGLSLKERADVSTMLREENEDRMALYREIAAANGFPQKVDEIKTIFAQVWKDQASAGWFIERNPGQWTRK